MTEEDGNTGPGLSLPAWIAGGVGGLLGLLLVVLLSPPEFGTFGTIFFGGSGLFLGGSITAMTCEVIVRLRSGDSVADLFSSAQQTLKEPPPTPETDGDPVVDAESNSDIEKRFNSLRTLSGIFTLLAYLNGLVGTIGGAFLFAEEALVGIAIWAATAFSVVLCLALAECIGVILAIEENTRRTANAAEQKSRQ